MDESLKALAEEIGQITSRRLASKKSVKLGAPEQEFYYFRPTELPEYPVPTEVAEKKCPVCGSTLAIIRYRKPLSAEFDVLKQTYPQLKEETNLYCPVCGGLIRKWYSEQGFWEGYMKGIEVRVIEAKPWVVPPGITWHSITCPECGETFDYATKAGAPLGMGLTCPKCYHDLGTKEGYTGIIRKLSEVRERVFAPPTWTPTACPQCGTTFEYRTFAYPYGEALLCPHCRYNFGAKAGYGGKKGDIRNIKVPEKPEEVTPPLPEKVVPVMEEIRSLLEAHTTVESWGEPCLKNLADLIGKSIPTTREEKVALISEAEEKVGKKIAVEAEEKFPWVLTIGAVGFSIIPISMIYGAVSEKVRKKRKLPEREWL